MEKNKTNQDVNEMKLEPQTNNNKKQTKIANKMEQAPPPTGHVGEEQDALVEPVGEQLISQLLEDCHPNAEREGRVAEQQGVPKVQDLVQGKDVWKEITQGVPKKQDLW